MCSSDLSARARPTTRRPTPNSPSQGRAQAARSPQRRIFPFAFLSSHSPFTVDAAQPSTNRQTPSPPAPPKPRRASIFYHKKTALSMFTTAPLTFVNKINRANRDYSAASHTRSSSRSTFTSASVSSSQYFKRLSRERARSSAAMNFICGKTVIASVPLCTPSSER